MKKIKTKTGSFYIGPAPLQQDLLGYHFDIIWNLAEELNDLLLWQKDFAHVVLHANIPDFDIPSDIKSFIFQLKKVVLCLKNNGKVLVHCLGGHGRTGMAVACILSLLDGHSPDYALMLANKYCQGPETYHQNNFVLSILNNEA